MPTPHAQRLARVRRLHTVRSIVTRAVLARAARHAYITKDLDDERLPWEDAPSVPTPMPWLLNQPFLATLFPSVPSRRAPADPSWNEALRTDDTATPFLPEDWRLECITSGDDIPEYMGRDLDGLFL